MAEHYHALAPLETHWRKATCEEVDCKDYLAGWTTILRDDTRNGRAQADLLRKAYKKGLFSEGRDESGALTFTFPAGTPCLKRVQHRIKLDRPVMFTAAGTPVASFDEWSDRLSSRLDTLR